MGGSLDKFMNEKIFNPPKNRSIDSFKNLAIEYNNIEFGEVQTKSFTFSSFYSTESYKISFLKISPEGNFDKYIIFSHGNACDIYDCSLFGRYLSQQYNVCCIIYDYPGYGLSSGSPSEQGCYDALEAITNYVIHKLNVKEEDIIHIGQSLGTGVVIDYLHKNKWDSPVILISPYKSIVTVVADSSFVRPIDKFRSLSKLYNIDTPIKIFHGDADELINISHGKKIYQSLRNKKYKPTWIKGVGHNDILGAMLDYSSEIKKIIY